MAAHKAEQAAARPARLELDSLQDEVRGALRSAYALLISFQQTIDNALEGDHPDHNDVDLWLTTYERMFE